MRTNKKRPVKISTLWEKEVVNEKFRLKITHIFACGCFRKYRNLEKLHIFNSIAYGVRFSPISVYLNINELKYA